MADIADVARAAGVSTATVSRALSGRGIVAPRTKELVQRVADELVRGVRALLALDHVHRPPGRDRFGYGREPVERHRLRPPPWPPRASKA